MFHIALHFLVPLALAYAFCPRQKALRVFLILSATILVDIDHLLADPIYDSNRCSIGFHPMHHYLAIGLYGLMTLIPRLGLIGLGLVLHMLLDFADCLTMT